MDKTHAIQRRDIRYPISAEIELTDEQTGHKLRAECINISACGCFAETNEPFLLWTRLKLRIAYRGQAFVASGAVMHSTAGAGMGIEFMEVAEEHRAILNRWLAQFAEKKP